MSEHNPPQDTKQLDKYRDHFSLKKAKVKDNKVINLKSKVQEASSPMRRFMSEISCSSASPWLEKAPLPLTLRCNWTDFHQLAIFRHSFSLFTSSPPPQRLQHLPVLSLLEKKGDFPTPFKCPCPCPCVFCGGSDSAEPLWPFCPPLITSQRH